MASIPVEWLGLPSGLSLTFDFFPEGSDTAAASAVAAAEATNRKGLYVATVTSLSGHHTVHAKSGAALVGTGRVKLVDTTAICRVSDEISSNYLSDVAEAIWTYATRTLTSFTAVASSVWTYATRTLTMTAQEIEDVIDGTSITKHRGDTWSISITGLGDLSNYEKLWFTVKSKIGDPEDTKSIIQITNPGGLVYINKAAASTASNGSITIDDTDDGDITITLKAVETAKITPLGQYTYDVQVKRTSSGNIETLSSGDFAVNEDVTKATS